MQVQIVAKKSNEWRGAVIVDGEFQDALLHPDLTVMVQRILMPLLEAAQSDARMVNIMVNITGAPKADKSSG